MASLRDAMRVPTLHVIALTHLPSPLTLSSKIMKHLIFTALLVMTLVTTCNASNDYQELIANSEARVYQGSNGAKLPYQIGRAHV